MGWDRMDLGLVINKKEKMYDGAKWRTKELCGCKVLLFHFKNFELWKIGRNNDEGDVGPPNSFHGICQFRTSLQNICHNFVVIYFVLSIEEISKGHKFSLYCSCSLYTDILCFTQEARTYHFHKIVPGSIQHTDMQNHRMLR